MSDYNTKVRLSGVKGIAFDPSTVFNIKFIERQKIADENTVAIMIVREDNIDQANGKIVGLIPEEDYVWKGTVEELLEDQPLVGFHLGIMTADAERTSLGGVLTPAPILLLLGFHNDMCQDVVDTICLNLEMEFVETGCRIGFPVRRKHIDIPRVTSPSPGTDKPWTAEERARLAIALDAVLSEG